MNTDHKDGHYEIIPILLLFPREDQLQLNNTWDRDHSATPRWYKLRDVII